MSYIVRLDDDTWLVPRADNPAKSTMCRKFAKRWGTVGSARDALARARSVQPFSRGSIESTIAQSHGSLDVAFEEFREIVADKLSAIASSRERLREFGHVPREPGEAAVQVLFSIWLTVELERVTIELAKVEHKAVGDDQ